MAQPMIIISLTVVLMCCCSPRKARDKPQLSKKARMPSKNKRKTSNSNPLIQQKNSDALNLQIHNHLNNDCCFEGDRLFSFLNSFQRLLESELQSNKRLPEKLWLKQHFAVGINEVTRLLERTLPCKDETFAFVRQGSSLSIINRGQCYSPCPATELQAVLVASDCNSRWLTKHLPTLASSRNVPLIYVKDNKEGSLRLGEAVKVKTAIALGIKFKGSSINQLIEEVLHQEKLNGTGRVDSTELPAVSC